ncbi:synaptotagmin-16-like isoform X3 [Patiria miniata]|uniref:C2 domain-containing protein n=1 Tax=Patiria miniata TaxID=46514 RepID=A0A914BFM7_PATMI|nr:synaptotagmin-16-like isoform X3 [Patiria miniata]
MGKKSSLCCCCRRSVDDLDDEHITSTPNENTPLMSSGLTTVSELEKSVKNGQNGQNSKPQRWSDIPDVLVISATEKCDKGQQDKSDAERRISSQSNRSSKESMHSGKPETQNEKGNVLAYAFKTVGDLTVGTATGVRADDISLAEQGGAQGSVGSLEYRDDPEDTRVDDDGDESYLVAAEEPLPEDLLANQDSAPTIGQLEVVFDYSGDSSRMNVTIMRGLNLPTKDKGGASAWRLRILLYPKKQRTKTRIRETEEPVFKELFRFTRIRPHELVNTAIRLRLYAAERMRKERLVGEGLVKFASLSTSAPQTVMVKLVSRSETLGGGNASPYSSSSDLSASGDSNSSLQSLSHGGLPELLVGLTYNATTGRLAVELIKGSHFKQQAAGRAPDSYVRISLMSSSGFEMTKSKTSVRRGQPNPTFKETFIFQVAQFQLADVTLMFTVFNKRGMKRKETIGWFSMGLSNSSDEETGHWKEMRDSKGHQVCRWHILSNK